MTVWAQFMTTSPFYGSFFASLTSTGRQMVECKAALPAPAVSPPSGGGMTQSRRHCAHPGAQGHLRPPHELRGKSSAVRAAQRQLKLSQRAQPSKLIEQGCSGFEMMGHLQHCTHLAPLEPSWTWELRLLPGYTTYPHNYLVPKPNLQLIVPATHQSP